MATVTCILTPQPGCTCMTWQGRFTPVLSTGVVSSANIQRRKTAFGAVSAAYQKPIPVRIARRQKPSGINPKIPNARINASYVDDRRVHDVRVEYLDKIVRSHRLREAIGQLSAGVNPGDFISVRTVLLMSQFSVCPDSLAQSRQFYAQAFVLDLPRNFALQMIRQGSAVRVVHVFHGLLALQVPVTLNGGLTKKFT